MRRRPFLKIAHAKPPCASSGCRASGGHGGLRGGNPCCGQRISKLRVKSRPSPRKPQLLLPMAEARIPIDLFNPGQVFACLGFLEAADTLLGDARGGFDWSNESD